MIYMRQVKFQQCQAFWVNPKILLSVFVYIIIALIGYQMLPLYMRTTCVLYYGIVSASYLLLVMAQPHRVGGKVFTFPMILSGGLMWWLLGFRDISGVDDETYNMIFDQVATMSTFRWIDFLYLEPGYLFFNYIISLCTDNYYVFQAIASFIPIFFIYKGFVKYKYLIYIPLAFLLFAMTLFFQMLSVSLIRMFIAISLVFYFSLDFLIKAQLKKYILSIILISTIHYSCIIMLIFVPLLIWKKQLEQNWISFLISLSLISITGFLVVGRLAAAIGGRYAMYGEVGEGGFNILALDTLPFFIVAFLFKKIIPKIYQSQYMTCVILLAFSSVFSVLSGWVPLGRVIFYTNLSIWIILPAIFKFSRHNWLLVAIFTIIYCFLYLYATQFLVELRAEHLFPYRNIFFTL